MWEAVIHAVAAYLAAIAGTAYIAASTGGMAYSNFLQDRPLSTCHTNILEDIACSDISKKQNRLCQPQSVMSTPKGALTLAPGIPVAFGACLAMGTQSSCPGARAAAEQGQVCQPCWWP